MRKNVLIFSFSLLLGFTTTLTLNANSKIEALTKNVESLQVQLGEVKNDTDDLKNEVSEVRNSFVNELSLLTLRIEKIEN